MKMVKRIEKLPYVKFVDEEKGEVYVKWGYDMSQLDEILRSYGAMGWVVIIELEESDVDALKELFEDINDELI